MYWYNIKNREAAKNLHSGGSTYSGLLKSATDVVTGRIVVIVV